MKIVGWSALGACAALVLAVIFLLPPDPPSDEEMLQVFNDNRELFEQLRGDLCKYEFDQGIMMDPEWTRPPLPQSEKQRYHAIFQKIGIDGVQVLPDPCRIWFSVWAVGFAGDGDYKRYRYGPSIGDPLEVQSLDQVDRTSNVMAFYTRRIDGDWWLDFDHWP